MRRTRDWLASMALTLLLSCGGQVMPTGGTGPVVLTLSDGTSWSTAAGFFAGVIGDLDISGNCGSTTTAQFAQGSNGVVNLTGFQGNLPIPLQPTGDGTSATASNVTLFGRTDHTITVTLETATTGTISATNPAGGSCIAPFAVRNRTSCPIVVTASTCPTVTVGSTLCLPCTSPCPTTYVGNLFIEGRPVRQCTINGGSAGTTCVACTGSAATP